MTEVAQPFSKPSLPVRANRRTASAITFLASYDLFLGALIIIAGSQGVYRFTSPLILWIAIYAMIGIKLATHFRPLLGAVRNNIVVLAYPVAALTSTIWSIAPAHSAYSAMQLLVTYLAGFWLGWRYNPGTIIKIITISLSPLILLSLANWSTGSFGQVYSESGGLLGIFGNKNTLGRMSLLLCLATMSLYIIGTRSPIQRKLLIVVFSMAILALLLSKSATSVIVLVGATCLLLALSMRQYSSGFRTSIGVFASLVILGCCVWLVLGSFDPAGTILELFGKSSNLTGRTSLWSIALQQIGTHPWLGVGYDVYWDSGTFPAVERIQHRFGTGLISFHNFVLDIWVGTGVLGLLGISLTIGTIAFRYVHYYYLNRSPDAAAMISILVAAIGVGLFNPLLFAQHGNMIVILVAFTVSARFR